MRSTFYKIFIVFALAIFFLFPASALFAQDHAPDRTWLVGLEKRALTAYEKSSDFKDSLSKDGYILSIDYMEQAKKEKLPDILKSIEFTDLSFRIGLDSTHFQFIHANDDFTHDEFADNPLVGLGSLVDFRLSENLNVDISVNWDFGRLDNLKHLHKAAGYVYAKKGSGSWHSTEANIGLTFKPSNISYFLGFNSYQFDYSLTFTDYPGYPSDYEQKGSGGIGQDGYFAGIEYQPNKNVLVGFFTNIPGNRALLEGYQLYAKYIL
jgi:hypothetical protein